MSVLDLVTQVDEAYQYRAATHDDAGKERLWLRTRRLNDYLRSLELRYHEVSKLTHELVAELIGSTRNLDEVQRELLDATSAFHEQAYNTLSCFTLFLQEYLPHDVKRGLSLGTSMQEVIAVTLPRLLPEPELRVFMSSLEEMRVFRTDFLVHPQKTAGMDWGTFSKGSIVAPYYFDRTTSSQRTITENDSPTPEAGSDDTVNIEIAVRQLKLAYPWMGTVVFPPAFSAVYSSLQMIIGSLVVKFRG